MREIAQFILNNYDKSTFGGEYNALFAIQSVPMLLRYYKIFKELNPKIRIGAIFTYAANASLDDGQTGMNQGLPTQRSLPTSCKPLWMTTTGCSARLFTTDNFSAYYDDVNERMKKRKKDMLPLDLLLVVGMFLTGFDAKKLNTLYVDKNLEYHGLLQAFSRTNRVLNEKKRFGKIVCFRDLKANVDAAIKLFSNNTPNEKIIRPPFEKVRKELNLKMISFLEKYPDVSCIDALKKRTRETRIRVGFPRDYPGENRGANLRGVRSGRSLFHHVRAGIHGFPFQIPRHRHRSYGETSKRALPTLHKPRSNTKISTTWISVWSCSTATSSMSPTFWR